MFKCQGVSDKSTPFQLDHFLRPTKLVRSGLRYTGDWDDVELQTSAPTTALDATPGGPRINSSWCAVRNCPGRC